jgi:hypothetical protein
MGTELLRVEDGSVEVRGGDERSPQGVDDVAGDVGDKFVEGVNVEKSDSVDESGVVVGTSVYA